LYYDIETDNESTASTNDLNTIQVLQTTSSPDSGSNVNNSTNNMNTTDNTVAQEMSGTIHTSILTTSIHRPITPTGLITKPMFTISALAKPQLLLE
ncbi:16861_t:CDS:1, partial [Gigaspora rosea]